MMIWIWTAIVAIGLIFEFITAELVCIWFAISGLISLLLASFGVGLVWQIVVFAVVSLGLLIGLRKICMKFLKNVNSKTNVETFSGKRVKLITPITEDNYGTAKIGDIVYNCKEKDGNSINSDELVEIIEVEGNKLIVKKYKKEN